MTTDTSTAPTQKPPAVTGTAASAAGTATTGPSPQRTAPEGRGDAAGRSAGTAPAAPTLPPPPRSPTTTTSADAGTVTATVWQSDKAITATWSDTGTRNAWALVDGVGWRKIFPGTDGAFLALTLLAAQARQTGHHVNYREDDSVIKEIYLW